MAGASSKKHLRENLVLDCIDMGVAYWLYFMDWKNGELSIREVVDGVGFRWRVEISNDALRLLDS